METAYKKLVHKTACAVAYEPEITSAVVARSEAFAADPSIDLGLDARNTIALQAREIANGDSLGGLFRAFSALETKSDWDRFCGDVQRRIVATEPTAYGRLWVDNNDGTRFVTKKHTAAGTPENFVEVAHAMQRGIETTTTTVCVHMTCEMGEGTLDRKAYEANPYGTVMKWLYQYAGSAANEVMGECAMVEFGLEVVNEINEELAKAA